MDTGGLGPGRTEKGRSGEEGRVYDTDDKDWEGTDPPEVQVLGSTEDRVRV